MPRHRSKRAATGASTLLLVLGAAILTGQRCTAEVPAPFTPLEASAVETPEAAIEVMPWGRTYRFTRGPVPGQIVSSGVELLREPLRWSIDLGDGPVTPAWSATRLESATDRVVTLSSVARVGAAQLRAQTRIEYDGMIQVDFEIAVEEGAPPFALRGVQYELPLRPGVARWFNHHVAYDYTRLNIDKEKLVTSVGRFPAEPRGFDYAPTFFLGNPEVGIEWWSDDDLFWKTGRGRHPIELEARRDEAILRIAPVSAALAPTRKWQHRFAFFPAPMRPTHERWRSMRFVTPSSAKQFEQSGFDYYWIAFPGQIFPDYHGLPATAQDEKQRALRADLRKNRIRYIPYGKLMAAPSFHPTTLAHGKTWAANRQLFTGPTGPEAALMRRNTSWKRGDWYSYNVCAARVDYFDWMLAENLETLVREDTDGIYFDFGSISSPCETDPRPEGSTGEQAWHYFELRDFYKRLYEGVAATKPEALIAIHTNGQPRALTAWVDYSFVGEALNALFRSGLNWKQIKERPQHWDADYFRIPEDFLMAQTMPPIGGVTSVLPQVHKARLEIAPEKLIGFQRGLLSQLLVNDTHFWFGNLHHPSLVQTIAALDRFGNLGDATFEPWWQPRGSIRHDSELKVSAYRRPGALLAVVANWTRSPQETVLRVPERGGASGRFEKWSDLEKGPRSDAIVDGKIPVRVPPHDFRLLMIR